MGVKPKEMVTKHLTIAHKLRGLQAARRNKQFHHKCLKTSLISFISKDSKE